MEKIKEYKKLCPTSNKILATVLLIFLFYNFGYIFGKFLANIGL